MQEPWSEQAEAVRELAVRNRHEIELIAMLAACGYCLPPTAQDFARWRARLAKAEAGARLLAIVSEPAIELRVRALDPRLAGLPAPTMWDVPAGR